MMNTFTMEMMVFSKVYNYSVDDVSDESCSSSENDDETSSSESESNSDESDSSLKIIKVTEAPATAKDGLTPKNAIRVFSEAYPIEINHKDVSLASEKPQNSTLLSDRICMLCLCEETNDELIECDACKIVVHEGWPWQ